MRILVYLSCIVSLFVLGMLPVSRAQEQTGTDPEAGLKTLVQGNNAFAFDLYTQLAKQKGNLFFSPHSVSNALAVVLVGAKGDTAKEIANVLGVQGNEQDFHSSFSSLNKRIQSAADKGSAELSITNAFWRQDGIELRPSFLEDCQKNYSVEFNKSDFLNDSEGARRSVNEWAEAKTKGKIKELLNPGSINNKTRFILVNAIYFKGKWSVPFPKDSTKEATFLAGFKDRVQVPMMNLTLITDYHSADGFQLVAIPYADNRLSLYAFMGESETALRDFESRLSPRVISDLLGRMKKHVVDVSIPKFRLEDHFFLSEPLGRLGMSEAFSLNADLSGIADSREKLRLGAVIHKTYLDLNEEGTEAAAATAVIGVNPSSFSQPIPRAKIVLDRPFLFLIRDNETGAVLFLGRLMNPRA